VEKVAEEEMLLARLKAEVAHFKGEVLNCISSISNR
jgi:cell division initiation protein